MIITSSYEDVAVPSRRLTEHVLERAREFGGKPAIIDGSSGASISYSELEAAIRALAGGLVDHGLRKDDVVAVIAPNSPEYAIAFHALVLAGAVVTTVNPSYSERELAHQLTDSGAVRVVTTVDRLPLVAKAAAASSGTPLLHVLDDREREDSLWHFSGEPLEAGVGTSVDDVAVLPYSSGTTGASKGVMLSHANMTTNIEQSLAVIRVGLDDTVMAVLPMFHIYGMQVVLNCSLRVGATVVTMPRFELASFLQLHERYGVTRSYVAPPIALMLAKDPAISDTDLSKLQQIFCGAAPLSEETAASVAARVGCEIVQGYGMTELSPASHLAAPGSSRPSSVGTLVPNTEMRIVDVISGASVEPGQTGEIHVRGPQVMIGYLNNEAATAEIIDADGWLHTGDIGFADDDGYLYVVDRVKELIKVKGFQVAPAELEALLVTHPSIVDAAVIGVPDEQSGEVPIAFVVASEPLAADDVKAFVAAEVATYKRLAEVRFVESIPKSPSGKILRRELRSEVIAG